MTRTIYELEDIPLTVPITLAARRTAEKFANEQPTPEKAAQVRLNTLCVWVVHEYLEFMGISTQLNKSDTWNRVIRICADIADLEIPGIGRLECRPVHRFEQICYIPPETWEERVGYVVVQINESSEDANLLGFVPSVATERLPLNQLQPLENLIEHLAQLRQSPRKTLVNLSQWLNGVFDAGWQTLESLWNQPELRPVYAFRNSDIVDRTQEKDSLTKRGKLIDLGIQIANQPVMLIVEIRPDTNSQMSVRLQVHPTGNNSYLIPGLQLTVLDESGSVFLESQARNADNYIQLQFKGEPGEQFSVKLGLNDASVTEHFVI
ncbi:DUF1822 family protein [Scytonema sp. UIC 10036]|uniref:DUF1822 family protein n=1 Tax=Scytonema sp. UIC 10036 TaxID=2304196 RepID=UPI0012DA0CFC|nr:DUF1822 family protein [Scytonema sp. UIC 10036]MUG96775.1 DUF1822 family protein [Scytonema sp. UIC 10036]